jgi:hypothetical protein
MLSEDNGFNQRLFLVAEDAKKIHDFAVDIIVSFNGRWRAIDDDSSGATKYVAKML